MKILVQTVCDDTASTFVEKLGLLLLSLSGLCMAKYNLTAES